MSVEFKSQVSSANVNQAFLDKNKDTATAFKLALNRVGSGATIADVQQAINDNLDSIDLHIADYTAHREFDTKANLDTWALTAVNGSFAFATDEKKSYQVIDTLLTEIGGGGGGLNQWVSATSYVIGDVVWLLADYKIYVCIADNSDVTFTPGNWQELSSNFLDGYFTITANDNITYTDSLGTELLRKESDVLFIEDFKENAPTTFLTASDVTVTVNDATNSTYLSNTIATFTQSSALTTYHVESNPIPVTKKSWLLEPIKIQAMQGIAGGAGTWDLRVFTSTDGIAYTDKNIIVQVGDLKNDKIITQLASDVTHIKLRWTIVNPDDATTLTLGGILITSQAFEVGQITKINKVSLSGNDGRAITANTESIPFDGSGQGWTSGADGSTSTTGNYYTKQFSGSVIRLQGLIRTTVNAGNILYLYVNGVQTDVVATDAGTNVSKIDYIATDIPDNAKVAIVSNTAITLQNIAGFHYLNITEEAYADNVIVDAATSGLNTQSYNPTIVGFGTPTNVDFTYSYMGDKVIIQGKFTSGTPTAVEARIGLPNNFTAKSDITNKVVGSGARSTANPNHNILMNDGNAFVQLENIGISGDTPDIGTDLIGAGESLSFYAIVPVNELDASSQYLMLDVSNERENVYSARIANNGTATITSQSSPFIESVTRNVSEEGRIDVVFKSGFFSVAPMVTGSIELQNRFLSINAASITTNGFTLYTTASNDSATDANVNIVVQRQGADYRPQKAFLANAVSIVQANTNGVEYLTNETVDGKQVYARRWKLSSNISSTTPIETIPTGLEPIKGTKTGASNWYITGDSYPFQSENYALPRYNSSTGLVDIEINNVTLYSGQIITLEYTKP